jgi:hypothetical protein
MKALAFALALLVFLAVPARAQEVEPPDGSRIASVQITGIDPDRLSPGLRDDINKLVGTPLSRVQVRELAARIEAEQPRVAVGIRLNSDPAGAANVAFVVGRLRDDQKDANVNARYNVESVTIRGLSEDLVSQGLRDDLHALIGQPFDADLADRLGERLRGEFPRYVIQHRTTRGNQPGLIKLIYEATRVETSRLLRFEPIEGNAIYHSDLGWGAVLPMAIGDADFRVTPILALDSFEELAEEYTGFGVRVESRKVGSDRLGLMFEWAGYDTKWRDRALVAFAARPDVPGPYGSRMNFTPLLKFAITPEFGVAAGVDVVELGSFIEDGPSQMANAATGSLRFNQRWKPKSGGTHQMGAVFNARAGLASLQSDYVYERYFGQIDYAWNTKEQRVQLSAMGGNIQGVAPAFERFTLGNSLTLRGWNKEDLAPIGANRMFSATVEYHYKFVMTFFDAGSVWDAGMTRKIRTSAGVGAVFGSFYSVVGFPLNTDDFSATFSIGFRFGVTPSGLKKF